VRYPALRWKANTASYVETLNLLLGRWPVAKIYKEDGQHVCHILLPGLAAQQGTHPTEEAAKERAIILAKSWYEGLFKEPLRGRSLT
jgi:hypothetical protein